MNKKNVPYDMLLILFGIISILLCYAFAFPFTIDIIFLLVGVMVVFLLLSWIIKSGNKKAFYAFLILFIVFLVITRDSLVIGFQNLYNQMTEIYGELKRLEKCSDENEELLSTLRLVAEILNGLKGEKE